MLLIHGGGSGIGTHAIQVGKADGRPRRGYRGLEVQTGHAARESGADILINYANRISSTRSVRSTDDHGADMILDNMGAKYLDRNVDALGHGRHVVIIGMQGGVKGELNFGKLLGQARIMHATGLRGRPRDRAVEQGEHRRGHDARSCGR